jgi:hypothetical protein
MGFAHKTNKVLDPFRFKLISLAGWMNQHQHDAIDYRGWFLDESHWLIRCQSDLARFQGVDDFVAVKASDFHKEPQLSTGTRQLLEN